MAGPTVIDQLIVTLGLRPENFTRGTKQAAQAQLNLEESTRKSAARSGVYLGRLAAKWVSVAGAILLVQKAVNTIDEVATRTRRLGMEADNLDQAANRLRNYENAVEMVGGTAEEARKSVGGFMQSLFNLAYKGEMSESLVMLARLGVQFQDAKGGARDFNAVLLDTADAIAQAQKQGMSRGNAFQYLQQSGFDQGTANLLLSGRAGVEAELARAGERRQVTDADVKKATDISRARIGKEQSLEGVAVAGMKTFGGVQETVNGWIDSLAGADVSLDGLAKSAKSLGDSFDKWSVDVGSTTRGMRNNNPMNLKAAGNQNADRQGFRVFGTMEEGIAAANAQLDRYAARGINTIEKIITTWAPPSENDTQSYIDEVVAATGMSADAIVDQGHRALLLAAMAKRESGKKGVTTPDSGAIADILQGVSPSPYTGREGSASNVTTVDIGSITVVTQARDAEGVAGKLDEAIRRKLTLSHAEQGMR